MDPFVLEIHPPFAPMEAKSVARIPTGEGWQYEPKWDGFRCLVFRDGKKIDLRSKSGQPLARYFPDVVEAVAKLKAKAFVLDGEIVVPAGKALSFDALLQRIHPAESRVKKLAKETPAILVVFDLIADERGKSLTTLPLKERRKRLEIFGRKYFPKSGKMRLSPATTDLKQAERWLGDVGATLDGIIAKRLDAPYVPDRSAMQKIKSFRSADTVVGGFRYGTGEKTVGSLLLGLYDDKGLLHHVGFTSSIPRHERKALTAKLEKLISPPGFTGQAPGGPSRWSTKRSAEWQPLKPKLVAEVCYDHVTGDRFRHGTKFMRWRPDKSPRQCTFDQLRQKKGKLLALLRK
jgi:ATP-dependent DNA ligase